MTYRNWQTRFRIGSIILMLGGLIYGFTEYQDVMKYAQSAIHEIYAVSLAVMWATFGYIAARALDCLGKIVLNYLPPDKE